MPWPVGQFPSARSCYIDSYLGHDGRPMVVDDIAERHLSRLVLVEYDYRVVYEADVCERHWSTSASPAHVLPVPGISQGYLGLAAPSSQLERPCPWSFGWAQDAGPGSPSYVAPTSDLQTQRVSRPATPGCAVNRTTGRIVS